MRKSSSCPDFISIKRNVSTSAIATPIDYVFYKIPFAKTIECKAFPNDILNEDDIKNLSLCIAEPSEAANYESTIKFNNKLSWLEKSLEDEEVRSRYSTLYSKIRKKKN
jgi:hypothetical protein